MQIGSDTEPYPRMEGHIQRPPRAPDLLRRENGLQDVILLGLSFMLIFTALGTTGNIVQIVLKSMQTEDPQFSGDGYISLALSNFVYAFANIVSPGLVEVLKAKRTLIFCSCFYVLFMVNMMFTTAWSLYFVSALLGLAAGGLWTAQGNYITIISNKTTIYRNTGIFSVFMGCSQFVGNGFVFWQFFGKTHIDRSTQLIVFSVLTGITISAIVFLLFLRDIRAPQSPDLVPETRSTIAEAGLFTKAIRALKASLKILKERNMQLLILCFVFLGTNTSLISTVYPTSIGFTNKLGTISKSLAGLSGILNGLGGVIGASFVIIFGQRINHRFGRSPLIIVSVCLMLVGYVLVHLNIPREASLRPTDELSHFHPPSPVIAMICSFLFGLGDTLFDTQLCGTLSSVWVTNSANAFAVMYFFRAIALAIQFLLCTQLELDAQLISLSILCTLASVAFLFVEKA